MTTQATFHHSDSILAASHVRGGVKREEAKPKFADLRLRIERLLREIFEGHEEFLGVTPD